MTDTPRKPRLRSTYVVPVAAFLIFVAALTWQALQPPPSLDSIFDGATPIERGVQQAADAGRLALVMASAGWCPPCNQMKATTLKDPEVLDWLRANADCLYLDVDERPDEAQALRVTSIPTFILYRDNQPIARTTGAMSAQAFLSFLERHD